MCIRLTSRKQISIPPCFTAHCGLFVRYRVTQRVTWSRVQCTLHVHCTTFSSRTGPRRPLGATRAGLTVTAWLGPADSPSFSLCAKAQRPLSTLFS
nr:hypothetical protein [uncultured bacterium]